MSSSFSVGNPVIVNVESLYRDLGCAGDFRKLPMIPTSADFGFPFSEAYEPRNPNLVGEFTPDWPDDKLAFWDNEQELSIYSRVLHARFGKKDGDLF